MDGEEIVRLHTRSLAHNMQITDSGPRLNKMSWDFCILFLLEGNRHRDHGLVVMNIPTARLSSQCGETDSSIQSFYSPLDYPW